MCQDYRTQNINNRQLTLHFSVQVRKFSVESEADGAVPTSIYLPTLTLTLTLPIHIEG